MSRRFSFAFEELDIQTAPESEEVVPASDLEMVRKSAEMQEAVNEVTEADGEIGEIVGAVPAVEAIYDIISKEKTSPAANKIASIAFESIAARLGVKLKGVVATESNGNVRVSTEGVLDMLSKFGQSILKAVSWIFEKIRAAVMGVLHFIVDMSKPVYFKDFRAGVFRGDKYENEYWDGKITPDDNCENYVSFITGCMSFIDNESKQLVTLTDRFTRMLMAVERDTTGQHQEDTIGSFKRDIEKMDTAQSFKSGIVNRVPSALSVTGQEIADYNIELAKPTVARKLTPKEFNTLVGVVEPQTKTLTACLQTAEKRAGEAGKKTRDSASEVENILRSSKTGRDGGATLLSAIRDSGAREAIGDSSMAITKTLAWASQAAKWFHAGIKEYSLIAEKDFKTADKEDSRFGERMASKMAENTPEGIAQRAFRSHYQHG